MSEKWCSKKDPSTERVHLQINQKQKSFKISQDGHLQIFHIQKRFETSHTFNTQTFSTSPQPPTHLDLNLPSHFFQQTPSCEHHKHIIIHHYSPNQSIIGEVSTHSANNHYSHKTIQLEALKWLDSGMADDKKSYKDSSTLERRLEGQGFVKVKHNEVKSSASLEMMNEMRASYKLLYQQLQELKQRWTGLEQLPCWDSYDSWCKKNEKIQLLKLNLEAVEQKLGALKGVAESNMVDWGGATKDPHHNLHLEFTQLYQQFREFHISFLASGYRRFPRQQDTKTLLNSKNKVSQAFIGQLKGLQRSLDDLKPQDDDYPQKLETYSSELLLLIKQITIFNVEWQDFKLGQGDLINEVNDNLDQVKGKFQENWVSLYQIPLDKPKSDLQLTETKTNYFKPHLQHLTTLQLLIFSYLRGGAGAGSNDGSGGDGGSVLETKINRIYKELEKEGENIDSLLLPWNKYPTSAVDIKADKDKIIKTAVDDISKWDTKGSIIKPKNKNLVSRDERGSGDNKGVTGIYAKNQTTSVIYGQGDFKNTDNLYKTSDISNITDTYREGDNTSVSIESITSNMADDNKNLDGYVVVASTKTTTITTRSSGKQGDTMGDNTATKTTNITTNITTKPNKKTSTKSSNITINTTSKSTNNATTTTTTTSLDITSLTTAPSNNTANTTSSITTTTTSHTTQPHHTISPTLATDLKQKTQDTVDTTMSGYNTTSNTNTPITNIIDSKSNDNTKYNTNTATTAKTLASTDTFDKHTVTTITTAATTTSDASTTPHQTTIKKTTTIKTNIQPTTTTNTTNNNINNNNNSTENTSHTIDQSEYTVDKPQATATIDTASAAAITTPAANITAAVVTKKAAATTASTPPTTTQHQSSQQQHIIDTSSTTTTDTTKIITATPTNTTSTASEISTTKTSKEAEDPKIVKMKREAEEEKRKWVERFDLLRTQFVKTPSSGLSFDDHIQRLKGFEQEAKRLQKTWIDSKWEKDDDGGVGGCDQLIMDVCKMISKKEDEKKDVDRKKKEEEEEKKRQENKKREEENKKREEEERKRMEDDRKKKEDEERKRIDEEKKQKEKEERMKQEEKKRIDEEKKKKEEEERRRREDEERKIIEEKKRKEEEKKKAEEEKKKKEDEEKRKKDDEEKQKITEQIMECVNAITTSYQHILDQVDDVELDTNLMDVIKTKLTDVKGGLDGVRKDWLKVKSGSNKDVETAFKKCDVIAQKIDKAISQKQAEIDRHKKILNTSFNNNLKRLQNLLKARQKFEGNPAKKDRKSLENDLTSLRDFDYVICRLFNNLKGDYTDLLNIMGSSAPDDVTNKYNVMKIESEGRLAEVDECKKKVLEALSRIEATDRKARELGWMMDEMEGWMDGLWIEYDVIKPKDKSLDGLQKFNGDLDHLQEEVSTKTGDIEEITRLMDKLSSHLDEGMKAKGHLIIKNWKNLNKQIQSDQGQCLSAIKIKSEFNVNNEALYEFLTKLKMDFDKKFPRDGSYDAKVAFVKETSRKLGTKSAEISKLRDMLFVLGDETGGSKVDEAWDMMEKKIKEEEEKLDTERTRILQDLQDKLDQTHAYIQTNKDKDSMKKDINGDGRVGIVEDILVGYLRELDGYEGGLDGMVGEVDGWFKGVERDSASVLAANPDVRKKVDALKNTVKDNKLKISNRKKNISDFISCIHTEGKDITDTEHLHKTLMMDDGSPEVMTYPCKNDVTVEQYVQALQTYDSMLDGKTRDMEKLRGLSAKVQAHTTTPLQRRDVVLKKCQECQNKWEVLKRRVRGDMDEHNNYITSIPALIELLRGMKTSLTTLKNNNSNNNNNNNDKIILNKNDWKIVEQTRKDLQKKNRDLEKFKKISCDFHQTDGWMVLWEEVKKLLDEFQRGHQPLQNSTVDATDAAASQDDVAYDFSQLEALEAWLDTAEARLVDSNKPHPMEFSDYHHASDTIKQLDTEIEGWREKVEHIRLDVPKMARQTPALQKITLSVSKAVDRWEEVINQNKLWSQNLFRFLCSPDFLYRQWSSLDDALTHVTYDLKNISDAPIVPQTSDAQVNHVLKQIQTVQKRLKDLSPSVSAVRKLNSLAQSSPPTLLTQEQRKYMKKTSDRVDQMNTRFGILEHRCYKLVDDVKKVVTKRTKLSEKTMAALESLQTLPPTKPHWTEVLSRGAKVVVPIQVLMLMLVGVAAIVPVCESSACLSGVTMSFMGGGPPM